MIRTKPYSQGDSEDCFRQI